MRMAIERNPHNCHVTNLKQIDFVSEKFSLKMSVNASIRIKRYAQKPTQAQSQKFGIIPRNIFVWKNNLIEVTGKTHTPAFKSKSGIKYYTLVQLLKPLL